MMNKQTISLVVIVIFLVFAPLSFAEIVDNSTSNNATTTTTSTSTVKDTTLSGISKSDLASELNPLKQQIISIEKNTNELKRDITDLIIKVSTLTSDLQSIQNSQYSTSTEIEEKLSTVNTGLAILQENVESTEDNLSSVQKSVSSSKTFTTFTFLIVLAIVAALTIFYFINKKGGLNIGNINLGNKNNKAPPTEVMSYITSHIKKGNKFPHIKQQLLRAGWSEQEINEAYQATMQKNYQTYLQKKGSSSSTAPSTASPRFKETTSSGKSKDHKKVLMIAGFGLFVLIGMLLLLRGVSTGQAINIKQTIDESGKITRSIECIDNTTLKPDESGCCLDLNSNKICDTTEEFDAQKATEDVSECKNHLECSQDKKCINNKCQVLSNLFIKPCSLSCEDYSVKILTSDKEEYIVRPNQGGYTAAGSLSWDILKVNNQCGDGKSPIPIEFTSYSPKRYVDATGQTKTKIEIIGKQIITLGKSQTSPIISHPEHKNVAFKLTADEIFSLC